MQQYAAFMRATIEDGELAKVDHFEHPLAVSRVPEVQKYFYLRNRDVARLQSVATDFLRAMDGEFWKFRMAVELHEVGHFADSMSTWKAKFSLWCSAVEALFTSNKRDHKGSQVAKDRIEWFLGRATNIYAPGDIQSGQQQQEITIEDIVDELYELRNCVAHGSKTPAKFAQHKRFSYGQSIVLNEVIHEALSYIIRTSLLRILENNLLENFADGPASEAYFGNAGLVGRRLHRNDPRLTYADLGQDPNRTA